MCCFVVSFVKIFSCNWDKLVLNRLFGFVYTSCPLNFRVNIGPGRFRPGPKFRPGPGPVAGPVAKKNMFEDTSTS